MATRLLRGETCRAAQSLSSASDCLKGGGVLLSVGDSAVVEGVCVCVCPCVCACAGLTVFNVCMEGVFVFRSGSHSLLCIIISPLRRRGRVAGGH